MLGRHRDVIAVRTHERIVSGLFQVIREQNDRIMLLAGNPWTLPPADPDLDKAEPVLAGILTDADQWPDEELS